MIVKMNYINRYAFSNSVDPDQVASEEVGVAS